MAGVAAGGVAAACGLGGAGGEAAVGYAVDFNNSRLPITDPITDAIPSGRLFYVRLEVPEPLDAPEVVVRLEIRVGGAHLQQEEIHQTMTPPWTVAVVPLRVSQPGEWNAALIANSRKITDVEFEIRRPD